MIIAVFFTQLKQLRKESLKKIQKTAMIIHLFIVSSAVQIYEFSYIHFQKRFNGKNKDNACMLLIMVLFSQNSKMTQINEGNDFFLP